MKENTDDRARLVQEVANQLGWKEDISKLIERVNQLDRGLVQEDEFIYIINWSRNCSLIHKFDQLQIPADSKDLYTIPDILVEINTPTGKKKFIIEIKTSKNKKLSWTERYFQGLKNYGQLLQIPVLIAWKWTDFDVWSLFDISHFEKPNKNYKITFEKAHTESLMSKYFGDCVIFPFQDFGFNISIKKVRKLGENHNEKGELVISWQTVVDDIYLTGKDNKRIEGFNKAVFSVLLSMPTEESVIESETHIITRHTPHPNKMKYGQSVPISLVRAFTDGEVNWMQKVKNEDYPIDYKELMQGLEIGIEEESIRSVLFLKPKSE